MNSFRAPRVLSWHRTSLRGQSARVPSEFREFSSERSEGTSEPIEFASCHRLSTRRITPLVGKHHEGIHRHWEFGRGAGKRFPAPRVRSRTFCTPSSPSEPVRGAGMDLSEHGKRLRAALCSDAAMRVRCETPEGRSQPLRIRSAPSVLEHRNAETEARQREDAPRDPTSLPCPPCSFGGTVISVGGPRTKWVRPGASGEVFAAAPGEGELTWGTGCSLRLRRPPDPLPRSARGTFRLVFRPYAAERRRSFRWRRDGARGFGKCLNLLLRSRMSKPTAARCAARRMSAKQRRVSTV